ncbi:MAG: DUF1801 domain-containing protein [Eubacteriales bacterium]
MRDAILEIAPESTEKISWNMPTFHLNGNLVHFAAFKNHVDSTLARRESKRLPPSWARCILPRAPFSFPYDQPIPLDLVKAHHRVSQGAEPRDKK